MRDFAMTSRFALLAAATGAALIAQPALAAPGDPIPLGDGASIDPILDARLRYEHVEQDLPGLADADAITLRLRAGAELKLGNLSLLAEGEGTAAPGNDYNAFPFAAEEQNRPYSVVADPENIELNRIQLSYSAKGTTVTIGRQRINLDDQRWVGSVGWRQNEQTFDAIRGQSKFGPLTLDATYAIAQCTIFGRDAGERQAYDGSFYLLGAGVNAGPVKLKAFSYLVNYDDPLAAANSSQTYGILATTALKIGPAAKLNLKASYARQSDWRNPLRNYSADYVALEAGIGIAGLTATGGYELLGSDKGFSVQTPLATLHKFNGWADAFLTTPGTGLQDFYGTLGYNFAAVKALPGLNANVTFHRYESDAGSLHYGDEWNASLGFKLGPVGLMAKYADYDAKAFGVDARKVWLQAEFAL
jgi:hypothetical protein